MQLEPREARGDDMFNIVRWSPTSPTSQSGEQYEIWGFINDDNMIVGIESWVEDAVAGDLEVQQRFEDYQEFDGVMVPTTMFQSRMGRETFRATITDATIHPADLEAQLLPLPRVGAGAVVVVRPRRWKPKSSDLGFTALRRGTNRWPSSLTTTSLFSRAARAKLAVWL